MYRARLIKLGRLVEVAELSKDVALAQFGQVKNREAELEKMVEHLRASGANITQKFDEAGNLGQAQRLENAYRAWCEQSIKELNRQRAALKSELEAARQEAISAVGKREAIIGLRNKIRAGRFKNLVGQDPGSAHF